MKTFLFAGTSQCTLLPYAHNYIDIELRTDMTQPFRQIILHAGLPKTGSTSIQNNCYRHRELLAEYGLEYPEFRLGERQLVNHSDPLTAILFDKHNVNHWAFRMGVMDRQDEAREGFRRQFARIVEAPPGERYELRALR